MNDKTPSAWETPRTKRFPLNNQEWKPLNLFIIQWGGHILKILF